MRKEVRVAWSIGTCYGGMDDVVVDGRIVEGRCTRLVSRRTRPGSHAHLRLAFTRFTFFASRLWQTPLPSTHHSSGGDSLPGGEVSFATPDSPAQN